jgi:hypothetical protein
MEPRISPQDSTLRGPQPNGRGSLENLLDQEQTMERQDVEMTSASREAESSTQRNGNRETLVRYNARSEMGIFTETRTAYLPLTIYFSINRTKIRNPVALHFRVDWPQNILSRNTLVQQILPYDNDSSRIQHRTHGVSNDMACFGARALLNNNDPQFTGVGAVQSKDPARNVNQLYPFPTTVKGNNAAQSPNVVGPIPVQNGWGSFGDISDANCIPAYRKWYAAMYQYAHCMETDWKVTYFTGDDNQEFQRVMLYEGMDCQSTGNTDTIPTDQPLGRVDQWPYLKKHEISQRTTEDANKKYIISGTWNPNQQRPNKMIANEEEIKTWTKIPGADFTDRDNGYREDVTLLHYSHPDSVNVGAFLNCRIDLRYKIQFKDLTNPLRWFGTGSAVNLSSTMCRQIPFPSNTGPNPDSNPEGIFINPATALGDIR